MTDRVGLGWRPELAAGILAHLDRIDVVELIADDYFGAPRREVRALRTLASQVPVVLHGVGLGLASAATVDERRLSAMARLVDAVRPDFWSEHLAFVRAGGREIGHLAAPPRNDATIAGTLANLERARARVESLPLAENVATLIDPPGSDRDEASWVATILEASRADLLLDLHNLHANAVNFGFDPLAYLETLPVERIAAVHLAGGRFIPAPRGGQRLLDDHLHDVPAPVYALLEEVAARAVRPLTVVLERDGAYPPMSVLLDQLDRARRALWRGRERARSVAAVRSMARPAQVPENGEAFQAFLARLYVDDAFRVLILADPRGEALRAGLGLAAAEAFERIDRAGLELAVRSFARKRLRRAGPLGPSAAAIDPRTPIR
jgi:hypothetical protein